MGSQGTKQKRRNIVEANVNNPTTQGKEEK